MAQAVLYVELVPTTTGIKRNVEKDLNGSFDSVEKRGESVFSKIGNMAAAAGVAVATAAAVLVGIAIKGGFSRMLKIEDATAKLNGLGHSATAVEEIMGSALAAVKGTAYGLDTAATVAASAVAAGIKPGKELEKYLRLTADAATIAGISMDEMGSIMNKVNANGKAMTENLNQLQDRGIPILQWLAKDYGVTTAAMSDMVSQGKVDAETFNRVLEENIGGAALRSGDTTRGAFANMMAALSRVGVALIEVIFPYFKTTFQGITGLLDDLTTKLGPIGDIAAEKIKPVADAIGSAFNSMGSVVSGVMSTLGPLIAPLGLLAAGALAPFIAGLPILKHFLPAISGPIGLIAGAIAALIAVSPELRASLGGAFEGIVGAIGGVMTQLAPVFAQLVPVIMSLAGTIGGVLAGAITALLPIIVQIITLFGGLLADILPMLLPLITQLGGFIGALAAALLPLVGTLITALMPVFQALVPVILAIIEAVLPLVSMLIGAFMPIILALVPVITSLVDAFMPLVTTLLDLLVPILTILGDYLGIILPPILAIIVGVIQVLAAVITWLVENVVVPLIQGVFIPIFEGLGTAISWVWENVIKPVFDFIGFAVTNAGAIFETVFGGLGGFFAGIWLGIQNTFKGFINFIIDGINEFIRGLNDVGNFISDITGGAVDINIGRLPRLANGALVSATPGGSAAILGEGRYPEAVVPLGGPQLEKIRAALFGASDSSGSGLTLNYANYGSPGISAEEELFAAGRQLKARLA